MSSRPTSTATPSTLREINASLVLAEIRKNAPISRAEVARRLHMTKPTVGSTLELLLAAGLVREVAPPEARHYGAVFFEPVLDLARVLGLDIGGRFVRGALSDLDGRPLARCDEPISGSEPGTILAAAVAVRDRLVGEVTPRRPVELALAGVPGVVDPDEGVIRQSNPPELEGVAIRAELSAALGMRLQVENDVMLATLGERAAGLARGVADFAFLSVGTGVGAGLVLGGRPHRGHRGAAGEVDDPPPGKDEAADSPSAPALVALAEQAIAAGEPTSLTGAGTPQGVSGAGEPASPAHGITPPAIFAAARAGDALARRVVAELVRRIAGRVALIARVVDVELVVLGGGLGLASEHLLDDVRAEVARQVRYAPRVEVSGLGDAPVLTGALARGAEIAWASLASRLIAETAPAMAKKEPATSRSTRKDAQ
jgi:predicted NBD/HSP70 family sugar kinase